MNDPRQQVERIWPALCAADRKINGGIAIEIVAAGVYAQRDGMTLEEYIVSILRDQRIWRQQQDGKREESLFYDDVIDSAIIAGVPVLTFAATRYGDHTGRIHQLAPEFIAALTHRLQERLAETR